MIALGNMWAAGDQTIKDLNAQLQKVDKNRLNDYKELLKNIRYAEYYRYKLQGANPTPNFNTEAIQSRLTKIDQLLKVYRSQLNAFGPEYALFDKKNK